MELGNRIQRLRKMQGISQDELADMIGVSRQAVSKWENQQSIPDLDKVIMLSDYFGVTTDYILKGEETTQQENRSFNTSQLLYIASTAFLVIGLLSAFDGWSSDKSVDIWGSMIIQAVGGAAYFIGRLMEQSKTPFMINWLNLIIVLFMPVSMIITFILYGIVAPYPISLLNTIIFSIVYMMIGAFSYNALKKYTK